MKAKLKDLQNMNKDVKKRVKEKFNIFRNIGKKENLIMNRVGVTSFKLLEPVVGENLVLIEIQNLRLFFLFLDVD